jgi:glycosyltransferase involved in cell wall biosynthesis
MAYTIYPRRGGLHEQVYLISRELRRRGYNVYILYYRHGLLSNKRLVRIPLYFSGIHPNLYSSIDKCDYVVMETAWPWLAAVPIRLLGKNFILHLHAIESLPDFGLPMHRRLMIKFAEEVAGRLASRIITVSLTEYSMLRARFGSKVTYIPLAIDLEERERYMGMSKEDARRMLNLPSDKFIVTFIGGMSYGANREAARIIATQIAPKVHELSNGKVLFLLVGPDPPPESIGLSYIRVTGYVESIAPYIVASDACIAPIYHGGGVKMKTLDCMSLRRIVIATRKAVEGTLLKPWVHYIPAEEPIDFAYKIAELLKIGNNEYAITNIANNGYNYVKANHSTNIVVDRFIAIFKDIIKHQTLKE